jgi:hypothetical protein
MNQSNNNTPPPPQKPDVSLGLMAFEINLDTGEFGIRFSNPHTMQLIRPEQVTGCFPIYGMQLLREELLRRSRKVVVA